MHQSAASTVHRRPERGFAVAAPHEWDGIGQALRAAYRDHHAPPQEMAEMLRRLEDVD